MAGDQAWGSRLEGRLIKASELGCGLSSGRRHANELEQVYPHRAMGICIRGNPRSGWGGVGRLDAAGEAAHSPCGTWGAASV